MSKLKKIFYIDAGDIPYELNDACMDIDDEFPLHYSTGVIQIWNDDEHYTNNPFVQWLIEQGFEFDQQDGTLGLLGVTGT